MARQAFIARWRDVALAERQTPFLSADYTEVLRWRYAGGGLRGGPRHLLPL